MLPIRDTIPSERRPVVTTAILAINVLAFFYELSLGPAAERFLFFYGLVPARLLDASQPDGARFVPLVTSLFLHGGWLHLGGNMLYLWIFADNVEDRLGRARFLAFYVTCGVVASLTHVFFYPGSTLPVVGASGAVAGVLGAYFVFYPKSRIVTLIPIVFIPWFVEIPAMVYLGLWFLMQLMSSRAEAGEAGVDSPGIAFMAHAGGFVAGAAIAVVVRTLQPPPRRPGWVQIIDRT